MDIQLKQLLLESYLDSLKGLTRNNFKDLQKIKLTSKDSRDFLLKARNVGLGVAAAAILYAAGNNWLSTRLAQSQQASQMARQKAYFKASHQEVRNEDSIKWYIYKDKGLQITFDQIQPIPKSKNGEECRIGDTVFISLIDDKDGMPEENDYYYVQYGNKQLMSMRITGYARLNDGKIFLLIAVGNGQSAPLYLAIDWLTVSHKWEPKWGSGAGNKVPSSVGSKVPIDTKFTIPNPQK